MMAKGKFLDLHRHLPSTAFVLLVLLVLSAFVGIFIYAGVYNIGADAPHSNLVYRLMQQVRENAIAHHSRGIAVPTDLNDPKRIASGAALYSEMCAGCHLGPGVERSEMSQGLYPPAPELAKTRSRAPAQQFWIIKHGVKLTAMPAWGKTHSDKLIWDMVAFLQALPKMTPEQFKAAGGAGSQGHDEMMKQMMPGMGGMTTGQAAPTQSAPTDESKPHAHGQ